MFLLAFVVTGCTGSFNLTRKVYNFHRSQPDKWTDEIWFLVVALLPVYGLATFADAIVFNSIEFWTEENPIEMDTVKTIKEGDKEADVSYNPSNKEITVNSDGATLILEKKDNMIITKNAAGEVQYTSMIGDQGEVTVYDQDLKVVKTYSADELASLKAQKSIQ